MRQLLYILVLQMMLGVLASKAFAKDSLKPLVPGTLFVSFSGESANLDFNTDLLAAICKGVGQKLTVNSGVFGMGIFSDLDCTSGESPKGGNIFWLKIREDEQKVIFTIGLVTTGNPFLKMAEVSIGADTHLQKLMSSGVLTSLISYSLLDQMPFQVAFGSKRKPKKHKISEDEVKLLAKGLVLQEEFIAFSATADEEGLIYPDVIGRITTGKIKSSKRYLHASDTYDDINWRIRTKRKKLPEHYFGIQKGGRALAEKSLAKILDDEVRLFYSEQNESLVVKSGRAASAVMRNLGNSGYLGLRYGPALIEGDLIDQSKYFGALVEFRSGILGGLRLYHDRLPEVSGTINGQTGTFGGNRTIVAYSFSLSFDSWIRKIDLTPKIGVWNFRSKTPVEIEPGVYLFPEFIVKSAPSFDVELGIETGSAYHILRGWASNGASVPSKSGAEISSSRVGLDLLFSPWGGNAPVTISLLSFFFYEVVKLKRTDDVIEEGGQIDELNYSQGYAGGGVAMSW